MKKLYIKTSEETINFEEEVLRFSEKFTETGNILIIYLPKSVDSNLLEKIAAIESILAVGLIDDEDSTNNIEFTNYNIIKNINKDYAEIQNKTIIQLVEG